MPTIKVIGKDGVENTDTKTATISSGNGSSLNPPEYPELKPFTKPQPIFKSDLQRHYRFEYYFGLDNVEFKSRNINLTCGKITNDIHIGNVKHLELEADYSISEYSSVEFSIIDQDKEVPIMPINDDIVRNEKIFFGLPLRFPIDKTKPYYIKKDGVEVNITPEAAINSNDGLYTITYTPVDSKQYEPIEDKVKLKVILRLYDKLAEAPFIKSALIRGYGGDALWTDRP